MQTKRHKWKKPIAIIILIAAVCSIFAVPSKSAEAATYSKVQGTISGPKTHEIE